MRKDLAFIALAVAGTLLGAPSSSEGKEPATGGREKSGTLPSASGELRIAGDFNGMRVEDMQGEEVGEVNGLIVDPREGKMAYVVVATGKDGEGQVIVPWSALQFQQRPRQDRPAGTRQLSERVLVIHLSRDRLRQAPGAGVQTVPGREEGRRIHEFYGVSPYWEEGDAELPGP